MATRMQQRRGTAAEWTTINPILAAGEIGYETDTGKFKIGDGTNVWADLVAYGSIDAIIDAAPETLDTLNELAAAINDDPDFYNNISTTITNAVAQLNTSIAQAIVQATEHSDGELADEVTARGLAEGFLQDQIDVHTVDISGLTTSVADNATATSSAIDLEESSRIAEDAVLQTNIDTEEAARLQGDADLQADITTEETARIAGDSAAATDATAKADAAEAAANTHSDTELASHNSSTTSVHGIADTSVLATDTDVSNAQTAAESYADGLAINYDAAGSAATAQTAAEGHADGEITAHAAVTTNVHGIADTSDLALLSAAAQTFSGDITIAGDFTVNGANFSASATSITIEDNIVQLAHQNSGNTVDLGLVVGYNDGGIVHAGIVRDVSDDTWKLFKGVSSEPATTVAFTEGSLDDLALNNLTAAGVVFTDGTQVNVGVPSITPISEKTASYTLSSSGERDTIIEVNSASATTLTIPTDATIDFPVGTTLDVIQTGTGQVTFAGDNGVTVNATPGLKLRAQWSSVTLLKRSANSWIVFGDTAA